MDTKSKILITGARGMLGKAIVSSLKLQNYDNILTPKSSELNLIDQQATSKYFAMHKPEYVFHCAAKVGGIHGNLHYPAQFIYENLMMQTNTIHNAYEQGAKKLLFLGSTCIYPKDCIAPYKETDLYSGPFGLENKPYAMAKCAGLEMCHAYTTQYNMNTLSVMPPNLYGPGDHYGDENNHFVPALVEKFVKGCTQNLPSITVWGTGNQVRELLYSTDAADGVVHLMKHYNDPEPINLTSKTIVSVREVAEALQKLTNFEGEIIYDTSALEGVLTKYSDGSKISQLDWSPKWGLEEGLKSCITDYKTRFFS